MLSLIIRIALIGLVAGFLIKLLKIGGAPGRSVGKQDKKRINTEGLDVKDADYSEIKEER